MTPAHSSSDRNSRAEYPLEFNGSGLQVSNDRSQVWLYRNRKYRVGARLVAEELQMVRARSGQGVQKRSCGAVAGQRELARARAIDGRGAAETSDSGKDNDGDATAEMFGEWDEE